MLAGLALLVATSGTLRAYGESGHRIVGLLAEMHLRDSRALAEVRRILKPQESLADASVWPDTIKNPLYEDEDTPLFRLEHPGHDTYHYANLPFQTDAYALTVAGARPSDMVQTMRECIRVLRGESTAFRPRPALRMLAHLVGDVHQPLHVGNAFVSAEGPLRFVLPSGPTGWRTALGGNMLVYGPEDRFNLHSYWDTHAVNITLGRDDPPAYAARLFKQRQTDDWRNEGDVDSWPAQWATESIALSRQAHAGVELLTYLGPDLNGRNPHRWRIRQPKGYDELARRHVPRQLAAAGQRLARTLRTIWADR